VTPPGRRPGRPGRAAAAFRLAGRRSRRYLIGVTRSNRPNRRIPRSHAIALHRHRPLVWPRAEVMAAAVALSLLAIALLLP